MKIINKKPLGFTLVELLVVVAILGIITTISVVAYNGYMGNAKDSDAQSTLQTIAMMQEQYQLENNTSNYFSTGSSCSENSSQEIGRELFGNENALNSEYFNFCINSENNNGYRAKASSKKDNKEWWIDNNNNKNW